MRVSPDRIRVPVVDFEAILEAARRGEEWAFNALFRNWSSRVTGFVRAQGVGDIDGVVNDVFVRAFRALPSFSGDEAAFRSWLFRIARNRVIDEYRKQSRTPTTTELTAADDVPSGDVALDAERNFADERVVALLSLLTPEQREVLALRFVADLTIDQIAAATGRRRGAVKQLQRRGLRRLETVLEHEGS